jgi:hypothetical protein
MGLLSRLFATPPAAGPADPWSPESVSDVLRQFPIGSRVLYAPETKRELRLESVLMGYSVDRHLVYARDEVVKETIGGRSVLRLRTEGPDLLLEGVRDLHFLVPFQTRSEIDFRPPAREEPEKLVQKPVNDFERGNHLTLFCFSPYGRVPNIGTLVRSTAVLPRGPYANQKVAVLDPLPGTLSYADKRRLQRVRTQIPAMLQIAGDASEHAGLLEDFSERFIRVRAPAEELKRAAAEGKRLIVRFALGPESNERVTLHGAVSGRRRDALVVELKSVVKNGKASDFLLLEQIELKSALLQHPSTQKRHGD